MPLIAIRLVSRNQMSSAKTLMRWRSSTCGSRC
jgi:hypothetical protein